jgi:hypothetical protein
MASDSLTNHHVMDRPLPAAVIASFRDATAPRHRARLRQFSAQGWQRNFRWLDASGLALYFLQRLRALEIEDAVPEPVLSQLEQRHADNEQRTATLFEEVVRINALFRQAGVRYVNLKGFTLVPDFCPDLSLRYQSDCDFLIANADAARCETVLHELGYSTIAANDHVIELKTDAGRTPPLRDLYKAKPQRSVELHRCDSASSDRHPNLLKRSRLVTIKDHAYPALSPDDLLLSQALHLFRHLRSEWTRISWLLEFRHFVLRHSADITFWQEVLPRATEDRQLRIAMAAIVKLSQRTFGRFASEPLTDWSCRHLPGPVGLWIDHFGDDLVMTDFPGSKLYLLLEQALDGAQTSAALRKRLFPRRAPAPIVAPPALGFRPRMAAAVSRWGYFFFRLRFHITAGMRYVVASWRWKRLHKSVQRITDYTAASCATNTVK